MRKRKAALLAVATPLFVTPAVLLLPKLKGSILGLSSQFWSGFVIGLGIVLALAAIAAVSRKPDA